jgi:hypothetical protein
MKARSPGEPKRETVLVSSWRDWLIELENSVEDELETDEDRLLAITGLDGLKLAIELRREQLVRVSNRRRKGQLEPTCCSARAHPGSEKAHKGAPREPGVGSHRHKVSSC